MRIADRHLGIPDRVIGRLRADMAEVDHDAEPVHLVNRFTPKIGQSTIMSFETSAGDPVLGVIRQLHDLHAKLIEQLNVVEPILETAGVLPA